MCKACVINAIIDNPREFASVPLATIPLRLNREDGEVAMREMIAMTIWWRLFLGRENGPMPTASDVSKVWTEKVKACDGKAVDVWASINAELQCILESRSASLAGM